MNINRTFNDYYILHPFEAPSNKKKFLYLVKSVALAIFCLGYFHYKANKALKEKLIVQGKKEEPPNPAIRKATASIFPSTPPLISPDIPSTRHEPPAPPEIPPSNLQNEPWFQASDIFPNPFMRSIDENSIIKPPKTVAEYAQAQFGEDYKQVKRLNQIASFFKKNTVYDVIGDGNCFCHSAAVGLLQFRGTEKAEKIVEAILEARPREPYIKPDTTIKGFSKENDYAVVLANFLDTQIPTPDLLNNPEFNACFSRVIRHVLLQHPDAKDLVENRAGKEIDVQAITLLNAIFDLKAKLVVLSDPSYAGPEADKLALSIEGINPFDEHSQQMIDLNQASNQKAKTCDFLIVRNGAHFIAMV